MKILALEEEHPGVTFQQFEPHLEAESRRAWDLVQSGVIREMYFRADYRAAVLMLECASVEEAKQVLNTLPLVQAGLISFNVIPLIAYSGFARLFVKSPDA